MLDEVQAKRCILFDGLRMAKRKGGGFLKKKLKQKIKQLIIDTFLLLIVSIIFACVFLYAIKNDSNEFYIETETMQDGNYYVIEGR